MPRGQSYTKATSNTGDAEFRPAGERDREGPWLSLSWGSTPRPAHPADNKSGKFASLAAPPFSCLKSWVGTLRAPCPGPELPGVPLLSEAQFTHLGLRPCAFSQSGIHVVI